MKYEEKIWRSVLLRSDFLQVHSNVGKTGRLQSQGTKGKAVVGCCDPLATPDLESSGFSGRGKKMEKNRTHPGMDHGFGPSQRLGFIFNTMPMALAGFSPSFHATLGFSVQGDAVHRNLNTES